MEDPNPLTAGKSIQKLREAGVQVDVGCCETEARRLNEVFIKYITTGRPFVIAKCAMTLDGKIASRTGHSKWITCELSRTRVHEIRAQVDGILVGSRTVMLDDPSLTCRLESGFVKDPVRIILDAAEYLDSERKIFPSQERRPHLGRRQHRPGLSRGRRGAPGARWRRRRGHGGVDGRVG